MTLTISHITVLVSPKGADIVILNFETPLREATWPFTNPLSAWFNAAYGVEFVKINFPGVPVEITQV